MNERASGGNSRGKKSKPGNSNAANSTKTSIRTPQRITTVQKLHLRLLEAGVGTGDRRSPSDMTNAADTGPGLGPLPGAADPTGQTASRDSSPGIDLVPPPQEPAAEKTPPSPPKKAVKRTAAQIFREMARCKAEQEEEIKR